MTDRESIAHAHTLAANAAGAVGMPLGMWAGRGVYSTFTAEARRRAGRQAFEHLDAALVELHAVRDRLAEMLSAEEAEQYGSDSNT